MNSYSALDFFPPACLMVVGAELAGSCIALNHASDLIDPHSYIRQSVCSSHRYFNCNYGLYFQWWDRMFRTNHPDYHKNFDAVRERAAAPKELVSADSNRPA